MHVGKKYALPTSCACAGSVLECEGNDRSNISLPGRQLQLLQDAANYGDYDFDTCVHS